MILPVVFMNQNPEDLLLKLGNSEQEHDETVKIINVDSKVTTVNQTYAEEPSDHEATLVCLC